MGKRAIITLLIIILVMIALSPLFFMGAILLYSPSDEHILDYVEDLINRDMDAYHCEIIESDFSTNVREYSLYAVVQIDSDFDVSGFETNSVYPAQIQRLLSKAYGTDELPQNCFYIADDELSCAFDQHRKWLILEYK